MRIVYLHGFASSPRSSKAQFFGEKFRQAGIPFVAPELDQGKFEELTITGQLAVIEDTVSGGVDAGETVLMGSSLGGYLAALFAAIHISAVKRLILLAPAFHFLSRWHERMSPQELEAWKTRGWASIYHYGSQTERRLSYRFLEDGARYPPVPDFPQPALLLHGSSDEVVPAEESRQFTEKHPHARLVLFPSGHELTDVLDGLWKEVAGFLEMA